MFVRGLYHPEDRRLYWFVREDVTLATYGRDLSSRHDVTEEN